MKSYDEREKIIVREAVNAKGSQAELARYMDVPRQQVGDWLSGKCHLRAKQLLRLQDLVKRAACVLIALAGLTQAPHSGATGVHSEPGQQDNFTLYTLCVLRYIAALFSSKANPPLPAA